ncbi:D-lyxose/D-mannose family sugar isomerase [Marispirochaeta sp.]|uniref:D-lyxose/D-mannose family sugar isomerase n=1 Tax=Marispirochaeta sp. TaxID=2038653 RepID=UPI0029C9799C|nr:D-lyxose/D-mannose family sugar isomerase [Marispirochaeta sp.]
MKRSEINTLIEDAKDFFREHKFYLPKWAFWKPEDWKTNTDNCDEIFENMLGWDLTDYGQGRYNTRGLLLFTIRNGKMGVDRKPYAEKIMIVGEEQETPYHYHWHKMEDIINRGGGNLVIDLYNADEKDEFSTTDVKVKIDGVLKTVPAGGRIVLEPGESICLEQRVYHRFFGESGKGRVLVGEVSQVNDDQNDNRFYDNLGRFPEIEEDVPPLHLLVTDYENC